MQASTKKILAIVTAGLTVTLIAFVAVMVTLVRGADTHPTTLTAYAHGTSVEVAPLEYCTLYLEDCKSGDIAQLDVPTGYPLQLSLPKEIADAPWRLVAVYEIGDGTSFVAKRTYTPGEATAVTVEPIEGMALAGVEIQLPSAVIDEEGLPQAHAVWSIKTA